MDLELTDKEKRKWETFIHRWYFIQSMTVGGLILTFLIALVIPSFDLSKTQADVCMLLTVVLWALVMIYRMLHFDKFVEKYFPFLKT